MKIICFKMVLEVRIIYNIQHGLRSLEKCSENIYLILAQFEMYARQARAKYAMFGLVWVLLCLFELFSNLFLYMYK